MWKKLYNTQNKYFFSVQFVKKCLVTTSKCYNGREITAVYSGIMLTELLMTFLCKQTAINQSNGIYLAPTQTNQCFKCFTDRNKDLQNSEMLKLIKYFKNQP